MYALEASAEEAEFAHVRNLGDKERAAIGMNNLFLVGTKVGFNELLRFGPQRVKPLIDFF